MRIKRLLTPQRIGGTQCIGKRSAKPRSIQERLRALMEYAALHEVLADLIARETITKGSTFTFHGLRKNACYYQPECGLNDSEVGEILGMSPEIVRHYGKRARALMIARGAAERMTGGKIVTLPGATARVATQKT